MEENEGENRRTQDQLSTMSQSGDKSSLQSEEVPLPEEPEVPEHHVLLEPARNPVIGVPVEFSRSSLPTKAEVLNHYLHLRQQNMTSGVWHKTTPVSVAVEAVGVDLCQIWDQTKIPNIVRKNPKYAVTKIQKLLADWKKEMKLPKNRRSNDNGVVDDNLHTLFDIAVCHHISHEQCDCQPECKVPDLSWNFLQDQRSSRSMSTTELNMENADVLQDRLIDEQEEHLENNEDVGDLEFSDEEHITDDYDSDEDWVDINETVNQEKGMSGQNRLKLKIFARECDRYKISNRAGAKLANALMKDIGFVTKSDTKHLVCPSKLRRERSKWGKLAEHLHSEKKPEAGLYFDGKKCDTLVRDTNYVDVQGRGRGGKKKTISTTSTKIYSEEHYSCVSQPSGDYLSHVSPASGSGKDIAQELSDLVRERGIELTVCGCDGTAVNTGKHNGALRHLEINLDKPVQHFVCLLHCNELSLRHLIHEIDGVTQGPESFSGPIGKAVVEDVWKEPVVAFQKVSGKVPVIPEDVVQSLSRDQRLLYKLGHAVQSGVVPDDVAGATLGPCCHARWLTCACRICRKYMSVRKPGKSLKRLIFFIVNHYIPSWFKIKCNPHCQSGAENFFYMVSLAKDLPMMERGIVERVLQTNCFWSHGENIIIGCLRDARPVIRRKAVLYIMAARRDFDEDCHPRKWIPATINFKANIYVDLINWDTEQKTEPPLTMQFSDEEILSALDTPMILPNFPNHIQSVEHIIPR